MAYIELNRSKLQQNYHFLDRLFQTEQTDWAIVTKLLCGNTLYLKELIDLGVKELCDSRVSNLKAIKKIGQPCTNGLHQTTRQTQHQNHRAVR